MQQKHLDLNQAEVKFGAEGSLKFSGYASVFNGLDAYNDTVEPGAYKLTLEERKRPVQLRWNHYGPVIGKFTNIYEDEKGLYVEGELTKGHSVAEDAAALLRHGAISGMSIGYVAKDSEQEGNVRKLKQIDLIEISLVETPADLGAQVDHVKSSLAECESLKQIEAVLRQQCSLSRQTSTAIVSAVKNAIKRSDCASAEKDALETLRNYKLKI